MSSSDAVTSYERVRFMAARYAEHAVHGVDMAGCFIWGIDFGFDGKYNGEDWPSTDFAMHRAYHIEDYGPLISNP